MIKAPAVKGYVSFSIFAHECFHHVLDHLNPSNKTPEWWQEVQCWGLVRALFEEHELTWTNSVQNHVRLCLSRMIVEDIPKEEHKNMCKELKALKILEDSGM